MKFRQHIVDILKINPNPSPYPRMIVCIFSSTIPLLLGYLTDSMPFAIFGGLTGFLLVLNDHMGSLGHRLLTVTLTWIFMALGLGLGILLQDNLPLQIVVLSAYAYFIGLMGGGKGAELERAVLYGCFQFLAGCYNLHLNGQVSTALGYSFFAYFCVIVILSLVVFLRRHNPSPHASLRKTFKSAVYSNRDSHIYAFFYTLTLVSSLLVVRHLNIDHGYWAVGTTLLIMRPEFKNSVYRAIQRLLGTVLGVLLADLLIMQLSHPLQIIPAVGILAFLGPMCLVRSYWLGSLVVTAMMLTMLDLPFVGGENNFAIPFVRLTSTALGCGMALVGVVATLIVVTTFRRITVFLKDRSI